MESETDDGFADETLRDVREDYGTDTCRDCGHDLGTEQTCMTCELARMRVEAA